MLPFKVFSLAVLIAVVSSQGLPTGGMGGASVQGGMGGAGVQGGMGGAGVSGGMRGAGMYGGMGGLGMFGGMGGFMNADMMDTMADMYGSGMFMPGYGMGSGMGSRMGSGLGNFPNQRQEFPMGQFLPRTAAFDSERRGGRPPTQTFTGIGAIIKTISGINGGGGGGKPTLTNPTISNPVSNPASGQLAYLSG